MAVAPSFQKYPTYGDPYEKNGRQYIRIVYPDGHHREVRWYAESPSKAPQSKTLRSLKDTLGFTKGYITIFKGDTYSLLEWFRAEPACRYHKLWGWYVISEEEVPQLPAGIEAVQLQWNDVAYEGEDALKGESAIKEVLDNLMYEASASEWQGEIGERLEIEVICSKVLEIEGGYYGPSNFHLFIDEAGNEYCWSTASKKLEEETNYKLRGTVKAHQIYRNSKQTVLTRCMLR